MNKIIIFILINLVVSTATFGQNAEATFTLKQLVDYALQNSIAAKQAETNKETMYWMYRRYKSEYNPQLILDGTTPDFTRIYEKRDQDNGTQQVIFRNDNSSSLSLNINQNIAATGAEVYLNTGVERVDNLIQNEYDYLGTPVEIGFRQPLFQFNELKWDKKIEPLKYEESLREFFEDLENVSIRTSYMFFELMVAQISLQISKVNLANNDTIYKIAEGRYNLGKIAENELLQLELTVMNSRQNVAQAELDLETAMLRLKAYTGLQNIGNITLILPDQIPTFPVDENLALEEASSNRQQSLAFTRRKLEADMGVARAKGNSGPQANIVGRFGLTSTAKTIGGLYSDPNDQEVLRIGFQVPVLDWGRRKSSIKTAEAQQKLEEYAIAADEQTFVEEVYTQVRRFRMLREQVKITEKADLIGQKRYEISKNRYMIGKISITDLNIALTEKDEAKRRYIESLGNFWEAYYTLRRLTLYDFETNNRLLVVDDEVSYDD